MLGCKSRPTDGKGSTTSTLETAYADDQMMQSECAPQLASQCSHSTNTKANEPSLWQATQLMANNTLFTIGNQSGVHNFFSAQ